MLYWLVIINSICWAREGFDPLPSNDLQQPKWEEGIHSKQRCATIALSRGTLHKHARDCIGDWCQLAIPRSILILGVTSHIVLDGKDLLAMGTKDCNKSCTTKLTQHPKNRNKLSLMIHVNPLRNWLWGILITLLSLHRKISKGS